MTLLSELQSATIDTKNISPHWQDRCKQLVTDAQTRNTSDLLRWPSLADVNPDNINDDMYYTLKTDSRWETHWKFKTRECSAGNPKQYYLDKGTSPILLQHNYHVYKYEQLTGKSWDSPSIALTFEIGAGFGSFCRLSNSPMYTILDIPHMQAVQKEYLSQIPGMNLPVFLSIDQVPDVAKFIQQSRKFPGNTRFVATWSLAETPLTFRNQLFPLLNGLFDKFLIIYQETWDSIDNTAYFAKLQKDHATLAWKTEKVQSSSHYLVA